MEGRPYTHHVCSCIYDLRIDWAKKRGWHVLLHFRDLPKRLLKIIEVFTGVFPLGCFSKGNHKSCNHWLLTLLFVTLKNLNWFALSCLPMFDYVGFRNCRISMFSTSTCRQKLFQWRILSTLEKKELPDTKRGSFSISLVPYYSKSNVLFFVFNWSFEKNFLIFLVWNKKLFCKPSNKVPNIAEVWV